jgi:hypothetical protein
MLVPICYKVFPERCERATTGCVGMTIAARLSSVFSKLHGRDGRARNKQGICTRDNDRSGGAARKEIDTEIQWFNAAGGLPDWFDPKAQSLACLIQENEHAALLLMFNAGASDSTFDLPPLPQGLAWACIARQKCRFQISAIDFADIF